MCNRFTPLNCCCVSSYLGYKPTPGVPLDTTIGTILTNDAARTQSLADASLPGHDVVVATDHARQYKLTPGGRWASRILIPSFGGFCNFEGMTLPLNPIDVDIQYVWAPAEATGEDIFGPDSLVLSITRPSTTAFFDVALESDWDDEAYGFGIGPMVFKNQTFQFAQYVGIFRDSIYGHHRGNNPYTQNQQKIDGTELRIATYHRPIKLAIPRRLWIVNNMAVDWHFDGLSIWGITDDRSPERDAKGSCPNVWAENRCTIGNEPFAVDIEVGGLAGEASHLSIRYLNDHRNNDLISDTGTRWTGRACAMRKTIGMQPAPDLPAATAPDEEVWVDLINPNLIYTAQFGPIEILTVDDNNQAESVLCSLNLKIYRDGFTPEGFEGDPEPTPSEAMFKPITETDFTFAMPAWARGQMPTITIEPGATSGTILVNETIEGTCTAWIAPKLITRQKYRFEGWVEDNVLYGDWVPLAQWETETLPRIIVLRRAEI